MNSFVSPVIKKTEIIFFYTDSSLWYLEFSTLCQCLEKMNQNLKRLSLFKNKLRTKQQPSQIQ